MKPSAARLLLLNGAPAYRRLGGIVAGVALGVGMLLTLLGGYLHMPDREDRIAWRTYGGGVTDYGGSTVPELTDAVALRKTVTDFSRGDTYTVVLVAASATTSVTLPSGTALPGPGEYYASPAMAALIAAAPPDQLGDRFGASLGNLPPQLLAGPSDKVVVMGENWRDLAQTSGAELIDGFPRVGTKLTSGIYRLVLAVGAIAMLAPIVLLISIVSQLGAAQRRERFATARLIGAGRRAIANISGSEILLASLMGGVLGIGVAAALRPLAAKLSLNGSTSFGADLTPSAGWTAVAVIGVGLLGGAAAWWRSLRDDVGAPGSSRERTEKRVTAWHAVLLLAGLAMLIRTAIAVHSRMSVSESALLIMIAGFAATAFGMVIAGPWLTRVASRLYGRSTRSAAGVVAAGRLARHPRATFRSVAGLVIAVFLVSVFAGSVSAMTVQVVASDTPGYLSMDAILASVDTPAEAQATVAAVTGMTGVERVVTTYNTGVGERGDALTADDARAIGALNVPDAAAVSIEVYAMLVNNPTSADSAPPVPTAVANIDVHHPARVIVLTDGKPETKERVRTTMESVLGAVSAPTTRADHASLGTLRFMYEVGSMAYLGMAVAIGIAALSLTVATVAAALDRKRTFGLLRLSGMATKDLRRVIAIEAAVPLGATLLLSGGLGFFVAWLLIPTLGLGLIMNWPDGRYWAVLAGSMVLAVLAVSGAFGAVRRSTEVASTRFE